MQIKQIWHGNTYEEGHFCGSATATPMQLHIAQMHQAFCFLLFFTYTSDSNAC